MQADWRKRQLAKWGDSSVSFLHKFNPSVQSFCARHPQRCFTGTAPTLREVEALYGRAVAESWLDVQISDYIKFTGVKGKEEFSSVIVQVIQVIVDNFPWLKLSELMLFFQMCKAGKYGRFYGVVDAMVLTEALQEFVCYRAEQLALLGKKRQKERQREQDTQRQRLERQGALFTWQEWKEIKWLYNL